ncbi:ABC transporter permease [Sporomusa sp.]|uniref:ABC transporter permease n=1 Tax=Sporomusa sp. TaxID=2078658 RepID=UPI002CBBC805|nr:ABC transporter permease [Sporomusa sp.]HWR45440.1 ABC transporter permease [Sporomusa sp.]
MFLQILWRSLQNRKGRVAIAILAVAMGAAMVFALGSLSLDMNDKISRELRDYGANIVVVPPVGGAGSAVEPLLPESVVPALKNSEAAPYILGAIPYLYGIAEIGNQKVVLAGTDFSQVQKSSPWWKVQGSWPTVGTNQSIVGVKAATALNLTVGASYSVRQKDKAGTFTVAGIVTTGGVEDNQIFADLPMAQSLLGHPGQVSQVQVSAQTGKQPVTALATAIEQSVPAAKVKVVKQIAQAEGQTLGKIEWLMVLVTVIILGASAIAVMSTMTTTVLERTKEIGLMKAIGAETSSIGKLFWTEAVCIALLGGLVGSVIGFGVAQLIGKTVFQTAISFRPFVLPVSLAISAIVTLLASFVPVRAATAVVPAITLRGE